MCEIHWNRNQVDVDDISKFNVALEVMDDNEDHEPNSLEKLAKKRENN